MMASCSAGGALSSQRGSMPSTRPARATRSAVSPFVAQAHASESGDIGPGFDADVDVFDVNPRELGTRLTRPVSAVDASFVEAAHLGVEPGSETYEGKCERGAAGFAEAEA